MKTAKSAIKELDKRKQALAKERDRLEGLRDEYADLASACGGAIDALTSACDYLSDFV